MYSSLKGAELTELDETEEHEIYQSKENKKLLNSSTHSLATINTPLKKKGWFQSRLNSFNDTVKDNESISRNSQLKKKNWITLKKNSFIDSEIASTNTSKSKFKTSKLFNPLLKFVEKMRNSINQKVLVVELDDYEQVETEETGFIETVVISKSKPRPFHQVFIDSDLTLLTQSINGGINMNSDSLNDKTTLLTHKKNQETQETEENNENNEDEKRKIGIDLDSIFERIRAEFPHYKIKIEPESDPKTNHPLLRNQDSVEQLDQVFDIRDDYSFKHLKSKSRQPTTSKPTDDYSYKNLKSKSRQQTNSNQENQEKSRVKSVVSNKCRASSTHSVVSSISKMFGFSNRESESLYTKRSASQYSIKSDASLKDKIKHLFQNNVSDVNFDKTELNLL